MKTNEKILIGASGAADLLGIGRSLFYAMRSSDRLGPMPIPLGRRRLYNIKELSAWADAGCPSREKWLKQYYRYNSKALAERQKT